MTQKLTRTQAEKCRLTNDGNGKFSLCKESGCQARASRKTGRIVSARHFCARINPFLRRLAEAFPRADLKPFPRCRSAKVSLPRKSKKITLCARFSGRVAQSVRARHSHCRGHRFESCRDHHFAEKSDTKPRERRPFARFVFSPEFPEFSAGNFIRRGNAKLPRRRENLREA